MNMKTVILFTLMVICVHPVFSQLDKSKTELVPTATFTLTWELHNQSQLPDKYSCFRLFLRNNSADKTFIVLYTADIDNVRPMNCLVSVEWEKPDGTITRKNIGPCFSRKAGMTRIVPGRTMEICPIDIKIGYDNRGALPNTLEACREYRRMRLRMSNILFGDLDTYTYCRTDDIYSNWIDIENLNLTNVFK